MHQHRPQVHAILKSLRKAEMERFFFRALRQMMAAIVAELSIGHTLDDADQKFIIDHYTLAVLGHLSHWIATGMKDDPAELVRRLQFVMQGHVLESIERYAIGFVQPKDSRLLDPSSCADQIAGDNQAS
ncbi:hypothetical protein CEPID_01480 [Corynebacterium epidermidicanis]|uniref:Transcriptional regulator TetR C-terminal Firmicutes type domain-containing protein n=2 Tax=Corynebacterium epidermidicanis TaxID=1050174 RepID=A0A0G3GTP1_9CORY|nr:hypothetical protein CEPID_01480 [Corynebacterium epidermidicanis]